MHPPVLVVLAPLLLGACALKEPAATATSGDASGAATTTGTTTEPPTTGTTTGTTAGSTADTAASSTSTGGSSSGTTTSEPPACAWGWPEYKARTFCPPPAGMDADIGGTTPYGELALRYAHFGLYLCTTCPSAEQASLRLYADPPLLGAPDGDFLGFIGVDMNSLAFDPFAPGEIGGQEIEIFPTKLTLSDVVMPPLEQTPPPFDQGEPPVLSGTLSLTGNGWDVQGAFTATLCTELDWVHACE